MGGPLRGASEEDYGSEVCVSRCVLEGNAVGALDGGVGQSTCWGSF